MDNPLLRPSHHPPFDRIRPEHAVPAVEAALEEAESRLADLETAAQATWDGLMVPLRELEEPLDYAWSLVHHYMGVLNSAAWREAEKALQPRVVSFSLKLRQSESLYRRMEELRDGPAWESLSGPRRRILESALRSARLAGIALPAEQRQAFSEVQKKLAELGTRFHNNVLDATKAFALDLVEHDDVDGLPDSLLRAAAQAARAAGNEAATAETGPWRITLEAALFGPFMQYSRRRDHRETLYRAYVTRASAGERDNRPILEKILALRRRAAAMLGFDTYADLSLTRKMAPGTDAVRDMLERLLTVSRPFAEHDLKELCALARRTVGHDEPVLNWDIGFWSERLREERFRFTAEDLRPYFQFPRVLEGLFALTESLFDVRIAPADGEVPVWHADVRFFRVTDLDGSPVASFYLDPYSRPETKQGGAWMNPAAPLERDASGRLERPVAYLVCNQSLPVDDRPSLMTLGQVETLFHEFGHALQHMLTTVEEPEASGLHNIEWDAVEVASQFMENWCYHRGTLNRLSAHIETGAPIPGELYDRIEASRNFRAGSAILRQLFYAFVDLELHDGFDPDLGNVADVKARVAARTSVLPALAEDRTLCGFTHIFSGGYAAGYYSYKWAEVLAADAFAAFEEAGLDRADALRDVGRRYRDTILSLGGGTHPMEVFRAFRGRDPDPDALLRQCGLLT